VKLADHFAENKDMLRFCLIGITYFGLKKTVYSANSGIFNWFFDILGISG
jgi:hypothetical protein